MEASLDAAVPLRSERTRLARPLTLGSEHCLGVMGAYPSSGSSLWRLLELTTTGRPRARPTRRRYFPAPVWRAIRRRTLAQDSVVRNVSSALASMRSNLLHGTAN